MWYQQDPEDISLEAANFILSDPTSKEHFPVQFAALLTAIKRKVSDLQKVAQEQNPLAWVQPSFEQSLKLNCWIWGVDYIVDFDANRIGKTANAIFNALLWLFPNDSDWKMFKSHTDHKSRTYKILQRPPISALEHIRDVIKEQRLAPNPRLPYDAPENIDAYNIIATNLNQWLRDKEFLSPNPRSRKIWAGGPDTDWVTKEVLMPEFLKWCPKHYIESTSVYEARIILKWKVKDKAHDVTILFKSYDSEDTKWSGGAVDGIILSEGVPKDIFNEVRQRYKYPAFGSWDYTPYEPRNTAGKSALAHSVFKDPTKLPLNPYIFSGFGVYDAPSHILSDAKKSDLITMWKDDPQGDARLKGIFYSSSPVVLKNYDPSIHCLKMSFQELRQKWAPKPLILFRGIDPGWGHVTSCAWMALAPDNSKYIYKFYARSQRSIEERCEDIITLSENTRIRHPKHPQLWQEKVTSKDTAIRITYIDYHTFKTDEITKRPFSYNYINNGLLVRPSITYGPKERATILNGALLPQAHLPHPETKKPPGSKIYFLINEPGVAEALNKMSNLFWLTFEKGEKRGLTKDTVQDYDDDELDAACYVLCPVLNYSSFFLPHTKNGNPSQPDADTRLTSESCILTPS